MIGPDTLWGIDRGLLRIQLSLLLIWQAFLAALVLTQSVPV